LNNVEIITGSAANMPFEDNSIDLIVSNLGINNFDEPAAVFRECYRVLKPGGKLALTTNLNGHWQLFYDVFEEAIVDLSLHSVLDKLREHVAHRGTVERISMLFEDAGMEVSNSIIDSFEMRFMDGTAFLNHHFIKLGWMASWKALIPEASWVSIFTTIEEKLNAHAESRGQLTLWVPMAFIEGQKP
jgi:arsenite methyltransferase